LGEVKLLRVTVVEVAPFADVVTVATLNAVEGWNPPAAETGDGDESKYPLLSLAHAMASIDDESLLALLSDRISCPPLAPFPPPPPPSDRNRSLSPPPRPSLLAVVKDIPSSSVGRLGNTLVEVSPSVLYCPEYVEVSMGGNTPRFLRFS
jgi:hypothetical protein